MGGSIPPWRAQSMSSQIACFFFISTVTCFKNRPVLKHVCYEFVTAPCLDAHGVR